MRARIRTVKPEFFKDDELVDLEAETGLPIRLGFLGLFIVADREGRFEWRPKAIKAELFPYEPVDFERVMDALWSRGFIVAYESGPRRYGLVRTFKRHQHLNHREMASEIPPCPQDLIEEARLRSRGERVANAGPGLPGGKGREGNTRQTDAVDRT